MKAGWHGASGRKGIRKSSKAKREAGKYEKVDVLIAARRCSALVLCIVEAQ